MNAELTVTAEGGEIETATIDLTTIDPLTEALWKLFARLPESAVLQSIFLKFDDKEGEVTIAAENVQDAPEMIVAELWDGAHRAVLGVDPE